MKLVRYFLIIFALSLLLAVAGTWVINKGLTKSGVDFYGKINAAADLSKQNDLLLIGSSRVLVHLDPHILDSATGLNSFNYGLNAGSIKTWFNIAKCALSFQKNTKIVLLNVDYNMFDIGSDPYKDAYYYPFEEKVTGMVMSDAGTSNLIHNFKLLNVTLYDDYAKYAAIDGWLRPGRVLQGGEKGFYPNRQINIFQYIPDSITFKKRVVVSQSGAELLNKFINLCKEKNVKLILVNAPYFKECSPERYSPDYNSILNWVKETAKQNKVSFIDFTDMQLVNDKQYFYNVNHLNAKGASLYTLAVADSLKKYLPLQ